MSALSYVAGYSSGSPEGELQIAERAQNDQDFRRSVDTIYSSLARAVDLAQDGKYNAGGDSAIIEAQIVDIV
ncbi:hypothetical protein EXIGLDRAFT_758611 [Exidia glandulosa HHB12029]|uniref:Uncharacterized protein n=1 Tax=Exidia glandulosa HHB12029 TaxID=1314781 RepID=A0A165R0E4_EXIGL|nr:hypothetical protein EXIGLDRAFT_758611 [Exidia glandulosa HHB12029]